jgi:tetratricopeptide (TPR) repeat protein
MIRPVPPDLDALESAAFDLAAPLRCPPSETLLPALEGTLALPLRDRVLAHIHICEVCRSLAAALQADESTQVTGEEGVRIRARVARHATAKRYRWPAAAAAVLAMTATGLWMAQFQGLRSENPPAPNPPSSAPAKEARTFALALDLPQIELPASALVLRGEGASGYATSLRGALDRFRSGHYKDAAERLNTVIAAYPDEPHALYYLGLARLLDARPFDAVEPLEKTRTLAANDPWLSTNASWYLAVALERSDRVDRAILILTQLCGRGDARGVQACEALGTLLARRSGWKSRGATLLAIPFAGADSLDRHAVGPSPRASA